VARFKDGQTADDRQIVVGEDADLEMADIRAKPETLAALSRWSGGQVLAAAHNDQNAMSLALGWRNTGHAGIQENAALG